ncbi:hypothetical protein ACIOZM_02000 [Pseudomonas sp. NPDC087346]|uniref:hypothetical protein n=1 Tax=Pseudomonas sp. NPDC087346 TaxID=3364438 RepID=UPI003815616D
MAINHCDNDLRADFVEALQEISTLMFLAYEQPGPQTEDYALAQAGLENGREIVLDYVDHNEAEVAFEHLLYMVNDAPLVVSAECEMILARIAKTLQMPISGAIAAATGDGNVEQVKLPDRQLLRTSLRSYGSDRNGKIAAWFVTMVIALVSAVYAYKTYKLTRDGSDPVAQTCAAVVDARSSFLEVGAEAMSRTEPGRSKSRDQLEHDLRKLTEFANRSDDPQIKMAATNIRISLARGLNLTPENPGDDTWKMKLCLIDKFFDESELIASKCRAEGFPATPKPQEGVDLGAIQSVCESFFSSKM